MAFQMHRFAGTLAMPDAVRPLQVQPHGSPLSTECSNFPDLLDRNRYVCLVVKKSGRATPSSLPAISTAESKESEHGEQQGVGLVRP